MMELGEIASDKKREILFPTVIAMRDTVGLAKKTQYKPTYESAIQLFSDFSQELYEDIISILPRNIGEDARVYIAEANTRSKESGTTVSAIEVIDEEIDRFKELVQSKHTSDEDKRHFSNKLKNLKNIKKSLKPREMSENRILVRDHSKVDRKDFGATFIKGNDYFVDYKLKNDKYLRIRLLHPDNPEHITGTDLVYEQHDVKRNKIRVLFLQYKIWENGVLYFSKAANLEKQLERMQKCICDNGFCLGPVLADEKDKPLLEYRFPYCSAFLRPTDKLQEEDSKLISSGIHIPICAVKRIKEIEGGKIDKKFIRHQTLTHEMFEHLFNRELIGSTWLDADTVEEHYKEFGILDDTDSLIIYAREIKDDINDDAK